MASSQTHLIVGAGLAGAKAAEELRDQGFDGRVIVVGEEPEAPYERPPLSKDLLQGESDYDAARVHPESFYADRDVELLTGVAVTELDVRGRRAILSDRREVAYDRVLLATGAGPRRSPIPGGGLYDVRVLRSVRDADRLRTAVLEDGPLVIIGAGWIGCEVAASARRLGAEVTLIDQTATPLGRVLGPEVGGWFARLHAEHGVALHLGVGVERIEGDRLSERVVLTDGTVVETGSVLLAVGAAPKVQLAERAGLRIADGIVTDDHLRTSADGVFAAGDVASAWHPRYGRQVRVEHWSNALHQGPAAARAMLDRGTPYDRLPSFFTDQYDAGMEYVGLHGPDDRLVVRGSLDEPSFLAFWLDAAGRVTAGMHVGDWDAIDPIRALVQQDEPVDPEALAEVSGELEALVQG